MNKSSARGIVSKGWRAMNKCVTSLQGNIRKRVIYCARASKLGPTRQWSDEPRKKQQRRATVFSMQPNGCFSRKAFHAPHWPTSRWKPALRAAQSTGILRTRAICSPPCSTAACYRLMNWSKQRLTETNPIRSAGSATSSSGACAISRSTISAGAYSSTS